MPELTSSYIDSLAPNAAAIKNGQGLVKKKSFVQLQQSAEGDLLFGQCSGSGKSNYECSVDFIVPDKPLARCTCPSRQFPCKHALGLMYAFVEGAAFEIAPVPEDIASKREKAGKREENKSKQENSETSPKPKKVNKSALKKKINAQLEGLDVLEKLVLSLIRSGLGTIDGKMLKNIHEHVKQMGNYYLSGAQIELRRFALLLAEEREVEENYTYAAEQLTLLHAFIRKGRTYLQSKLEDPELALDHESTIEEWLGHAWQLTELKAAGRVTQDVELLQLSFFSYDDAARLEFVDHGYWMELSSGDIHRTVQYRPRKAAKHMREEDSFFEVVQTTSLYKYPGDLNARVRFEEMIPRAVTAADLAHVSAQAHRSFTEAFKQVKNQLKNPLSDKSPVLLLHAATVGRTASGQFVLTDQSGVQLVLEDISALPQGSVTLLPYLAAPQLRDCAVLVMFEHRLDQGRLVAQPLSIVKDDDVTRLLY
ncbi:SWIM zinc finger family protein [Paenibacillus donghaensis]|uniref:SWIM-type domain-containing protein n=1 Tax=Paenibacillus donghaensis TaxID=414771 RepID=A0A2Z2KJK1_9BACL|nr:SWIM zinc finger family protein [Paenibacillus donghaensis]ASA21122.1 hypothetical protein B9T62_10185 [Paenibacillus donghaensis]